MPREENRKNRHQAIVRTDVWYHSTVESRFNGLQGTGEKSILTVVRLMWDSTKWARSMDFRPTALSDSLYQADDELKPVIRFENAERYFKS